MVQRAMVDRADIAMTELRGVTSESLDHWLIAHQRRFKPRTSGKKKAGQTTGRKVFRRGCLKGPTLVRRSIDSRNCNVGKRSCSKRNR
jgi:hypothetical protein